jgi:hypothetical protein
MGCSPYEVGVLFVPHCNFARKVVVTLFQGCPPTVEASIDIYQGAASKQAIKSLERKAAVGEGGISLMR